MISIAAIMHKQEQTEEAQRIAFFRSLSPSERRRLAGWFREILEGSPFASKEVYELDLRVLPKKGAKAARKR